MNEAEWLSSTDPTPMLKELQARKANRKAAGRRKLVLFGCACCRRIQHLLTERGRNWLETAERAADGERVPKADSSGGFLNTPSERADCAAHFLLASNVMYAAGCGAERALVLEARRKAKETGKRSDQTEEQILSLEKEIQANLLREIFNNPYQSPLQRTYPAHIVGLALSCYASFPKVSDDFLILADALDELGEEAIAAHCREKLHVKGCHVIDLITERS